MPLKAKFIAWPQYGFMRRIALVAAMAMLAAAAAPAPVARQEMAYGPEALQRLDYVAPIQAGSPLIVYVHGGGWRRGDKKIGDAEMAGHFRDGGYAFASLNYRFVPEVTVAEEARDVAAGVAALRRQAAKLGFDPDRIVLIGHSAGAHLTALVSTDPSYFRAAGVPMEAVKGAVLLDGAGYDVPRQMHDAGPLLKRLYRNAFGTDAAAQRAVSPALHAAAPNVAEFLIVHDNGRADAGVQARLLGQALGAAGTRVEIAPIDDTNHMEINRRLGDPAFEVTQAVDRFAGRLLKL